MPIAGQMTEVEYKSQLTLKRRRSLLLVVDVVVTVGCAATVGALWGLAASVITVAVSTTIFHLIGWRLEALAT